MKNLLTIPKLGIALLLLVSAVLFSCSTLDPFVTGTPKVVIGSNYVLVPRAVTIQANDLKRLNKVLSSYDQSLYTVLYYDHGKRTHVRGKSGCPNPNQVAYIDGDAQKRGATTIAGQFGPWKPKPGTGASGVSCNNANTVKYQELHDAVAPILQKYAAR